MDLLITTALAVALATATFTDLRSQRIYNWLTFPLILSGLAFHTVFGGFDGLKLAAGGFALGFALMAIPYFMGAMGAGDVKLMAGVGAWLGVQAGLVAFLFTCIAGGVYALAVLAFRRGMLKRVLRNTVDTFMVFLGTHRFNLTTVSSERALPRLCYGLAIAVGTASAMGLMAWQTGSVLGGY